MLNPTPVAPPWKRDEPTLRPAWLQNRRAPVVEPAPDGPETLMERTRRLLRNCGKSLPTVHAELHNRGSSITFYWLRKFHAGDVDDPSVNRVEELYVYLTGKPLFETAA